MSAATFAAVLAPILIVWALGVVVLLLMMRRYKLPYPTFGDSENGNT